MKIAVVTAGLLLAGCEWLVPLDGLSGGGAPADGGVDHPPACPMDLSSDRLNCGACGHSCLGGDCVASRCQPVAIAEDQSGPLGIDVSARYVVWVNQDPPGLIRWSKDGSGIKPLSSPTDGIADPFDVALDADETHVYWSELTSAQVYSKPLAGGDKTVVLPGPGQAAFLALDGAQIYVTDHQMGMGHVVSDIALYSEMEMIGGLAVRDGILYFALEDSGKILAGPVGGGTDATVVVSAIVGQPMGVAVDADNIYWIEDGQRLKQAPRRGGGTPVLLYMAPQPFGASDVAADGTAVYWTEHGTGPSGVVRRLAR